MLSVPTIAARCLTKSFARAFASSVKVPQIPPCEFKPKPYEGPSKEWVMHERDAHVGHAIFQQFPLEGKMQWLWDEEGRRYLDHIGGIVTVSVGHCHPKVTEAAVKQASTITHTTLLYHNEQFSQYAHELTEKFPKRLKRVFFTNSGSEANDLAITLARCHTGNYDVLALRNGYHGMSGEARGLTAHSSWRHRPTQAIGIQHVACPDKYRGLHGDNTAKYVEEVRDVIRFCTPGQVAGFWAEPIQGVGGSVELPKGYLKEVYEVVRAAGGVCVSDEVQTGFGRLGTHYWGFEAEGVEPDIVVMAKGIGNGWPLAAVVTTEEISQSVQGKLWFNTYGGNPVSMAVGSAVLKVMDEENCQEKCLHNGAHYINGLKKLQEKHALVGDVRGRGLMIGAELVTNRETKEPATEAAVDVLHKCRELGLVIGKGGFYGNVLRIKPPMCTTKEDIDFALEVDIVYFISDCCQVLDVSFEEAGKYVK